MYDNIIKDLNVSVKILIMLLLIFLLFIVKSLYFVMFELILTIILIISSNESIKKYVNSLKIFLVLLPFVIIAYIMFKNGALLVSLKVIVIILLLNIFIVTTSFLGLYNGIYTLFKLYYRNEKKLNLKVLNISTKIYFLNRLFVGNEKLDKAKSKGLNKRQILNYAKVKYNLAKNDSEFIKNKLKLKIYSGRFERINRKSKIYLVLTILLSILVVLKEVI